ncbi:MAG: iron-sulfur cluster carrier protein [Candidatus Tectimicrobiota bacterium]|nr:MAG: iron-sulfur cluster carrier protein [Candidatus Tectomicrobia bacterium]
MPSRKVSEAQVYEALKQVQYPGYQRDIVAFGLVRRVEVQDGHVRVTLQLGAAQQDLVGRIRQAVEEALRALPGVAGVTVEVQGPSRPAAAQGPPPPAPLPGITHVIAVASGKGGVGKSTVATNLAVALGMAGLRTGLLDADIYGPSIPLMMGVNEQPRLTSANRILPFISHGIKVQSLGFFIGDHAPVIWRGPMVMKAVQQLLQETEWGELDVLVIDLPPGTGDVQLTLVQTVPLSGAILVTTPQDLALLDVKRGAEMFKQVNTPLLGIVENMSYFVCPDCGRETEVFRKGGGEKESQRLGVPLLGRLPLDPAVCEAGDSGVPIVLEQPDSKVGKAFQAIAAAVLEALTARPRPTPLRIIN